MPLFSAIGLGVLFVVLRVMMPLVFHGLAGTLQQFFVLVQDTLALAREVLATISIHF